MYQPGGSSSEDIGSTTTYPAHPQEQSNAGRQESLRDQAAGTMEQISSKAGEMTDRAKDTMQSMAEKARSEAGAALERMKVQGGATLDRGKDRAAQGMGHLATAIRETADRLRQEGDNNLAGYADEISHQLDRAAQYVQQHDVRGMINDLGNAVRRRPGIFFAGMFLGGLVAARFMKASRGARERESLSFDQGSDRGSPDVSNRPGDVLGAAGTSPSPAQPGVSQYSTQSSCGRPSESTGGFESAGNDPLRPATEI